MHKINGKTPVWKSLFNKVVGCRPATLLKRYSGTSVHVWVLPKYFQNRVFFRWPSGGCYEIWRPHHMHQIQSPKRSIYGVFLKFNQNLQKKNIVEVSFNKVTDWWTTTLLKKTSSMVLSYELYKIFKNTYFVEHLQTATSVSHIATCAYAKPSKIRIWFSEKLFKCILASDHL